MSVPAVGRDLFRWELAIPDLASDKTGKTGGDVTEILFEILAIASGCGAAVTMSPCIFSAETGGEQGSLRRWKRHRQLLYKAPIHAWRAHLFAALIQE